MRWVKKQFRNEGINLFFFEEAFVNKIVTLGGSPTSVSENASRSLF